MTSVCRNSDLAAKERTDSVSRVRPREVVPLDRVASELSQVHQLSSVFDSLCDRRELKSACDSDDRADNPAPLRLGTLHVRQGLVDLQDVDRVLLEHAERGVADPE